jgi:serine/threonine-protein kinase
MVLVPLVALLAGAVIATFVLQNLSRTGDPAPAAATNKLDTSRGIVLDAGNYVGRQVDEVADELTRRGLSVDRQPVQDADVVAGTVTGVSPSGTELSPGAAVTVSYAEAPVVPRSRPAPRTPAAVPSDPATAPTTEVPDTVPSSTDAPVSPTPTAVPTTTPTTASPTGTTTSSTAAGSSAPTAGSRSSTPTASSTTPRWIPSPSTSSSRTSTPARSAPTQSPGTPSGAPGANG